MLTCNTAVININTAKTEVLYLSRNSDQCELQENGATLKKLEKFRYLGVALPSDGKQDEELDTRISKVSAVMRALHYSVVMKRELSKKSKLSIFKTVFVPIFTHGHESWVTTKKCDHKCKRPKLGFYTESKDLHCLIRCVVLRFENLLTSSRYFFELKDLSLDGLAMKAECLRKDPTNKLYLPKQMGENQLDH